MKLERIGDSNKSLKVVIFLIALIFSYLFLNEYYFRPIKDTKYFKQYDIVYGHFENITRGYSTTTVAYTYNGEEKIIKLYDTPCTEESSESEKVRKLMFDMKVPVAVSRVDCRYAVTLIRPEDFRRIDLPFPDSLRLVYQDYFKCSTWDKIFNK